MPIMRKLVKLAVGYAVAKALARAGGPSGVMDRIMDSVGGGRDHRENRGASRTPNQKRADARRRSH